MVDFEEEFEEQEPPKPEVPTEDEQQKAARSWHESNSQYGIGRNVPVRTI